MFHTLMTLATTATVVLHALLGCCVHHAHAGQTLGRCLETVTVSVEPHSCQGHSHHHDVDAAAPTHRCSGHSDREPRSQTLLPQTPCSGSHGPHESCAEPDCLIVADQRGNDLEWVTLVVWSALLTDGLRLSSQEILPTRAQVGSPPDAHGIGLPLRIENQVWRL